MLKSLELFGFKSFADRTKFDFAPGVTGVVGPNGSGKSNVVDSIKWILGDQSPKSLRGKEMTDVIFNGSSGRKPAGFAEATLTFDNSKRVLTIDADEVHIGRRIYRSGEAEYLINRAPARLKDVKDLFLGTGAGTSAYSIIEQGRVDQLLQTTNVNRRNVFEEAAGISRFKVRKVDAQRKLERVAQNLLRLTDIVQEVEGRLTALRGQATKAARFRELSQELKTLRLGLAADDYRAISARLEEVSRRRAGLQAEILQCGAAAQDSETRQKAVEAQLAEAEDRLRAAERREAENREAIAGHEATLRHQTARRQELAVEHARLEQQQTELTSRADAVVGELQQTRDDLDRYSRELELRQAELHREEARVEECLAHAARARERLEEHRAQLLEAVRQTSVFENRVAACQMQSESFAADRNKLVERGRRLELAQAAAAADLATRRAELRAAHDRQAAVRDAWQAVHERRAGLLALEGEIRQRLSETREQRSALHARRSLLEDMERREEGLGAGAKDILARARSGSEAPWNQVRGHVVDLLEVDLENAALLEVALGGRADLIVLDDAGPLIDFLTAGGGRIAGRVGFLASCSAASPAAQTGPAARRGLPDSATGRTPAPDLSGSAGVVNRADRLVRSASGVHRLAEQLLADTWIVATLDDALRLATASGGGARFVTLQGELLESNGALYAGSLRHETALVSRKSELRGVKQDIQKLDRQIAGEEDALVRAAHDLRAGDEQIGKLRGDLDDAAAVIAAVQSAVREDESNLERVQREQAECAADLQKVDDARRQIELDLQAARADLGRVETEFEALRTAIVAAEQELAGQDQLQQGTRAALAAEQRALAQWEERLRNLETAKTRLDQERAQRDLHREEAERRLQLLEAKRAQIDVELDTTQTALIELTADRERLRADTVRLAENRERLRQSRGTVADAEAHTRRQLRDLKEQMHALEMQASEQRQQIVHLGDRLRDEYQVELEEAAATGVSARDAYIAAQAAAEPGVTTDTEPPAEFATEPREPARAGAPPAALPDSAAPDRIREELEEQMNRLRRKLKQLGQVNTDSLRELDELESRFTRLSAQLQDLVEARDTLEEIIRRINTESRRLFSETFDQIRVQFQELFRKLFGGGEGDVVLEDPNDILECGIDIVARPPGKELRSISLLSGGEKTMTAVALLLAIFKSRPSPFCILDEVDAALDEGNVERYMGVIHEFQQWTQFIVITHSKRTMSSADVLYGVTMEEAGVSKRMSVRFDDIGADGHFKASNDDAGRKSLSGAA